MPFLIARSLPENVDIGDVSDGFHTFNELYAHRCLLFLHLLYAHPHTGWRARYHADGSRYDGWFIAGLHLPSGPISYHLPERDWALLDACPCATLDTAPPWDGHDSHEVIQRLTAAIPTQTRRG